MLTAAHCQALPNEFVIAGRRDLDTQAGRVVGIAKVLNHADYDRDTNDNDLALLELSEAVDFPRVALHEGGFGADGNSTVVGWGHTQEGGPASPLLQQVEVPVVSNSACSAGYRPDGVSITDNMLCAGLAAGGKDSCQGDSGGPLLVRGATGGWHQAGIVSFGVGCARPERYGVYTRVSRYVPWIRACMTE